MAIPQKPNIIVILADDLGYGDIGAFGNDAVRTPHVDRLADQGVSLTQHYSGSPMCAPARASLLTGRYNHRTGAIDVPSNRGLDRISLRERTIADLLKRAGYATGMVGKWHNGLHDVRYHPNARGFDEFAGFLNGGMDYWAWTLDVNGAPRAADGRYLTDVLTQEAVDFIERQSGEPFFLYLAYNAPHAPFQAPRELVKRYQEMGRFTSAVSLIYAMVEGMDKGIGRVMASLEARSIERDTFVLLTSDNGPWFGGTGEKCAARYNGMFSGSKGDVLEGGIRVPAIVRWTDGLPAGIRRQELVHFTDWLPTLLALAGVSEPDEPTLDGQDVLPLLRGESSAVNPVRFWQWNRYEPVPHCNAAMRDGKWKLYWPSIPEAREKLDEDAAPYLRGIKGPHWLMEIDRRMPKRTLSPPRAPRLFDLEMDPCEKTDLAGRHPERVEKMKSAWEAWFETAERDRLRISD